MGHRLSVRLVDEGGGLSVLTTSGELLDPAAADVFMALGGDAPAWLPAVEGILAVRRRFPFDGEALEAGATAAVSSHSQQLRMAAESEEAAVLTALAAGGVHQVARNPNLDAAEWDLLRLHREPAVSSAAWRAAVTLPPTLAGHADDATRVRVARNPACDVATTRLLSLDAAPAVLEALAGNPATEGRILRRLLRDADALPGLARNAAANPSATRSVLLATLRHKQPFVRAAAAGNPKLPQLWARLLLRDRHPAVRKALAGRAAQTPHTLAVLERSARRDPIPWGAMNRQAIRAHPGCSARLARRLDELDRLAAGEKSVSVLRRLAPPSNGEMVLLTVFLAGAIVEGVFTTTPFMATIPVIVSSALLNRLRTVRPGMRVFKSKSTKKVSTETRLAPMGSSFVPLLGVLALVLAVGHAALGPSSTTSDAASVPGMILRTQIGTSPVADGPTAAVPLPTPIRHDPYFLLLESDVAAPAAVDDMPQYLRSLDRLLVELDGWYIPRLDEQVAAGSRRYDVLLVAADRLVSSLDALAARSASVEAWNAGEPAARHALSALALFEEAALL